MEEVRKGLNTRTLEFNRCKKKRTAVWIHCIKIAVLIWNKSLILIQMHPSCVMGAFCVVGCIFDLEVIITLQIIFFSKNIFKETLNKSRLKTVCTSCLHIFRKLAQKISKIMRQHYCGLFVQSDKKSDCAICTNDLISVSLTKC